MSTQTQPVFEDILEGLASELDHYNELNNDLARAINSLQLDDDPEEAVEGCTVPSDDVVGKLKVHIETLGILNNKLSKSMKKFSELV